MKILATELNILFPAGATPSTQSICYIDNKNGRTMNTMLRTGMSFSRKSGIALTKNEHRTHRVLNAIQDKKNNDVIGQKIDYL